MASVTWDGERIRTSVEFSGKTAEVSVKTPWRDVLAKYKLTGQTQSFTSTALLKWADDKQVTADVAFEMLDNIKTSFKLATPFYSKFYECGRQSASC